jgi:hypothetical protein
LGHDAGPTQERDGRPGWAGWVEFGLWPIENWKKGFLIFKPFLNSEPILIQIKFEF